MKDARDGYEEETSNFLSAYHVIQSHQWSGSIYVDLIALILKHITFDPLIAATLIRYVSSLLATVALYLVLSCFSSVVRPSAIVIACLLWIASYFNAPIRQSTSLTLFTFALILFGLCGLLRKESVMTIVGFYFFGLLSASMRPEYYLTVGLVTVLVGGRLAWRSAQTLRSRRGRPPFWTLGSALLLIGVIGGWLAADPPAVIAKRASSVDHYALFSLGQCYAGFYHKTHPAEAFSPMTEYQMILDREFHHPKTFLDAMRNNPGKALLYFTENGAANLLLYGPKALLGRYREEPRKNLHGWLYWAVRALLLGGAVAAVFRLKRASWLWDGFSSKIVRGIATPGSISWKLLLLLILMATSSVAVIMLIPTRRYYLPWIPLFYLGVACCADSLLKVLKLVRFEVPIVIVAGACLCSPNFLTPRPNYVIDAVRHAAGLVESPPRIAAWWAGPYVVLGLRTKAVALNSEQAIHASDIENGKVDILLIESAFRITSAWAKERDFFESFERDPERFGFKKLTGYYTGEFGIYYRPKRGA